jgi:predicted amidohydrolase YtcJ
LSAGRGDPDLVLTGGILYTPAGPMSGALAVRDGRIVAVGTVEEVANLIRPHSRVVSLSGRMIVPGFQDAHVHALHGGLSRVDCNLHDTMEVSDYLGIVARYAESHAEEFIHGGGWSMESFPGGTPHKSLLDAVVPDRPVYLRNRDAHGAWVNSKALELAGIDRTTPDPSGGRIERDLEGEPSGTLHEHAMNLVQALIPPRSSQQLEEGLEMGQAHLHSLGITAWQDPWITTAELEAYRALDDRGGLSARVLLDLLWERDRGEEQIPDLIEQRRWGTRGHVRATGIKFFQDGVVENFTAAMLEDYLDPHGSPSGNRGISLIEPDELNRYVTVLDEAGFQVHFHAIGDRAVRESLDAVEAAQGANGSRDARHHICHLQVVHPDDVPRFGALDVVANCQPLWACAEPQMTELTIPFLGRRRSTHQYPFESLRRAGATLAFGSDWTVSSADPLAQMEVAVTRVPVHDRAVAPFLPGERLSLSVSLDAFTTGSAFVNRLEATTGSIEPGKDADLAVLDRNILAPDAGPVGDARVVATLVGGRPVWLDPEMEW